MKTPIYQYLISGDSNDSPIIETVVDISENNTLIHCMLDDAENGKPPISQFKIVSGPGYAYVLSYTGRRLPVALWPEAYKQAMASI